MDFQRTLGVEDAPWLHSGAEQWASRRPNFRTRRLFGCAKPDSETSGGGRNHEDRRKGRGYLTAQNWGRWALPRPVLGLGMALLEGSSQYLQQWANYAGVQDGVAAGGMPTRWACVPPTSKPRKGGSL